MTDPTPYSEPQPQQPQQPYNAQPAGPKTNVLAIIALIGGFVVPLAGIIVGFIALNQIKTTGEAGRGLAIGGIVVGFVVGALTLLIIAVSVILPLVLVGSYGGYNY
ncbi:MAG: DUF4190 domain-containing protein [Rhodoglobus sp.]|uniref:DUF4190 domain-containing protein n=1 Tax=Salinibacterium sp. G-O1 TaxID=3046208 RepID=UPI0024BA64E0|nr:DUF4190 domain-containing protein [Salinibacterium sp. G-O1]MDJ0334196.1 DUF4190 domain-containing protein [Salinibacterium sp. G-O1]